jgi:hypothetical protein
MNKRIKAAKKHIEELKIMQKLAFNELTEAHMERFLQCGQCQSKSKVINCVGVDYHYWDDNTGSPCGGYYLHGYYAWECPKCKNERRNVFVDEDLYFEMYYAFKDHQKINGKR